MINVRLLMIALIVVVGKLSAQETLPFPEFSQEKTNQQVFLFGGIDAHRIYSPAPLPAIGLMYRVQKGEYGYDIAANTANIREAAELTATYNFYLPTEVIQPYIGVGAGILGDYPTLGITPVIPVVLGINSQILFADIGLSTYLGHGNNVNLPSWVMAVKPQARLGLGYQF